MNIDSGTVGRHIREKLGLDLFPVGMYFSDIRPEDAIGFKNKGSGCIMPLIFSAAKGKTVAFDKDTTGWDCSAFYLGYKDWIFKGIECFLSDGSALGRTGERFIKTRGQAKAFITSLKPKKINTRVTIFKPLEKFGSDEIPELVIFFANADQLSGLIFLLHFSQPERDDLVVTRLMSGCGSVVTLPMKYKAEGKTKAVCGMHDISARLRIPSEWMTLAMPFKLVADMFEDIGKSFILTENWERIKERN
jgi:uncharacterized protein YceK